MILGKYRNDTAVPKFLPQGFRFLRPGVEIKRDDYFWSPTKKHYFLTRRVGELVGPIIPYIRRK